MTLRWPSLCRVLLYWLLLCWMSLCRVLSFIYCYAECQYVQCHYYECFYAVRHYAELHYAECHYAECHYAECRGAEATTTNFSNVFFVWKWSQMFQDIQLINSLCWQCFPVEWTIIFSSMIWHWKRKRPPVKKLKLFFLNLIIKQIRYYLYH